MDKKYDVIIVGAGPAGIFTAYELTREHPEMSILMLEKGRDIYNRKCPKHTNEGICVYCKPCSITPGRMQASVNGVLIAREILNNITTKS